MRFFRVSAPRVVDGIVQRKNRWRGDPDYRATHQIRIERVAPRPGYRHYICPADVSAFLALLPDWRELAIGLQRVLLDDDTSCLGWHYRGTVALCAWEANAVTVLHPDWYEEHAGTLNRLRVPCWRVVLVSECSRCRVAPTQIAKADRDELLCLTCGLAGLDLDPEALQDFYRRFDEGTGVPCYLSEWTDWTIQAFQFVHVLVHELGHHHDRMTSRRQQHATRGERYAEEYALRYEAQIWAAYQRVFGRC